MLSGHVPGFIMLVFLGVSSSLFIYFGGDGQAKWSRKLSLKFYNQVYKVPLWIALLCIAFSIILLPSSLSSVMQLLVLFENRQSLMFEQMSSEIKWGLPLIKIFYCVLYLFVQAMFAVASIFAMFLIVSNAANQETTPLTRDQGTKTGQEESVQHMINRSVHEELQQFKEEINQSVREELQQFKGEINQSVREELQQFKDQVMEECDRRFAKK